MHSHVLFYSSGRDLVLPSFPTRRSSDLAADADTTVPKGHTPRRQWIGQRLLERQATLLLDLALGDLLLQRLGEFQLQAQHPDQHQLKQAHQAGHQIPEHRPARRFLRLAATQTVYPTPSAPPRAERTCSACNASMTSRWDAVLNSMTSRACST